MKKIPGVVLTVAVIIILAVVWLPLHDRAVRADERRRGGDRHDDSTVSRLIYENAHQEQIFQRQQDSTGRVIRDLRRRIAGGRPATPQPPTLSGADSTTRDVDQAASAPLLLRDSLIASLLSARAQDSLQFLFYRSQIAQRDSVISSLRASRDAWRSRSERRFACGGGAGLTVSLAGKAAAGPTVACIIRL